MQRPQLSFWQMISLNFGFLGVQFGWALQWANMSGIYKFLGVDTAQMAYLWIAAPLSGMIIQPIIGQLSDQTWFRLYRRRPYILAGAILSSLALMLMPNSTSILMATFLLWMLDGSVNIAMQPYRALVADVSPENQITKCFAIQSCLIGIGSTMASVLPWVLLHIFHVQSTETGTSIPLTIKLAFYIGSAVLLIANLWTAITTKEYPLLEEQINACASSSTKNISNTPSSTEQIKEQSHQCCCYCVSLLRAAKNILLGFIRMPKIMREVSYVQFFSWLGMFCVFLYFGLGVAQNIFGLPPDAKVETSAEYRNMLEQGIALGGLCFSIYTLVSVGYAFIIPFLTKRLSRKGVHALSLTLGAIGLIGTRFATNSTELFLCMIGLGAAWASIITIPYAILGRCLPKENMGLYMGLLNITICLPQIIASLGLSSVIHFVFNYRAMPVIQMAGIFFIVAAIFSFFISDQDGKK